MRTLDTTIWRRLTPLIEAGTIVVAVIIEAAPGEAFYLVNNTRPMQIGTGYFRPWPVKLGPISDGGNGDLVQSSVTIANVWRLLVPYMQAETWDQGYCECIFAYKLHEEAAFKFMSWPFRMQSLKADDDTITIGVGHPNYLDQEFPNERYIRSKRCPAIPRRQ